jgi:hypothetical protein
VRLADESREETMKRRAHMIDHMASLPEGERPEGLPYEFRRELFDP